MRRVWMSLRGADSGSGMDALSGRERLGDSRVGRFADRFADEVARGDQLVHVDAGLDTEAVEHVKHVFGRDVARRAFGVRTSAEAGDRAVESGDAAFERRVDVRDSLSVSVVEMAG